MHFAQGMWAGVQVLGLHKKQTEFGKGAAAAGVAVDRDTPVPQEEREKAMNNAKLAGKHDGKIGGVRYFRCPDHTGLFVRPSGLAIILR